MHSCIIDLQWHKYLFIMLFLCTDSCVVVLLLTYVFLSIFTVTFLNAFVPIYVNHDVFLGCLAMYNGTRHLFA